MDYIKKGLPLKLMPYLTGGCLILCLALVGLLMLFRGSPQHDLSLINQMLYASHNLSYQANLLSRTLIELSPDPMAQEQKIQPVFENQVQDLMQQLMNDSGWLISQHSSVLIRLQPLRLEVEKSLVDSLNAGRKLLAVQRSLHQLIDDNQSETLIRTMSERFEEYRTVYIRLTLLNQKVMADFIDQLELLHQQQLSEEGRREAQLKSWSLFIAGMLTLMLLASGYLYYRHRSWLFTFITTFESYSMVGFSSDTAGDLECRLEQLKRNLSRALDLQINELQKQRWKNAALEAAGEAILIADPEGTIQYTNTAFTKITGYDSSSAVGQNCSILSSGLTEPEVYNELWSSLTHNGHWHGELTNRRKNGDIFTQMTTISALYEEEVAPGMPAHQGYIAVMRDISLRKELEQELYLLSRQDGLTGLMNRKTALAEAENHVHWALRYGDPIAVIILDIDHFKGINDRWGHPVGDRAIIAVAKRCMEHLPDEGVLGRIGGEEFLFVLPAYNADKAYGFAESLRHEIAGHTLIENSGEAILLTCSFGISHYRSNGEQGERVAPGLLSHLIAQADQALYCAKNAGRNCVRVFEQ